MKNIIVLFICFTMTACSSQPAPKAAKEEVCTQYACPMHPDKTSTSPANCPECNMKMVPVEQPVQQSEGGGKSTDENK